MSDKIRLKVNGTIPGYPAGQVVAVEVDEHGTPLEELWRRRLKDAKIDGCVEVVPDPQPEPKAPSKSQQRRLKAQRSEKQ